MAPLSGDGNRMTPTEKVKRYIDTRERCPRVELDELVGLLIENHIDAEEAECLIAFVPIAFAHAVLSHSNVQLPPDFLVRDLDSGATVRGQLNDEPLFVTAKALAHEMLNATDAEAQCAIDIANTSAEMDVVRQLAGNNGDLTGIGLTETVLVRVPIEHVTRRHSRTHWKFWK